MNLSFVDFLEFSGYHLLYYSMLREWYHETRIAFSVLELVRFHQDLPLGSHDFQKQNSFHTAHITEINVQQSAIRSAIPATGVSPAAILAAVRPTGLRSTTICAELPTAGIRPAGRISTGISRPTTTVHPTTGIQSSLSATGSCYATGTILMTKTTQILCQMRFMTFRDAKLSVTMHKIKNIKSTMAKFRIWAFVL